MGLLDNFIGAPFDEKTALPPKIPVSNQVPVGLPSNTDPMADGDRKNPAAVISAALRSAQERDRSARYADFELMDTGDIQAQLDAVVDTAFTFDDVASGSGFKVECDDTGADLILQTALTQTGLPDAIKEIARDTCKYGDAFAEPVFDAQVLVDVQTYRTPEITRAQDDKGRLVKGKDEAGFGAAFQQKRQGAVVGGWQPWEMVHFKFAPEKKLAYSRIGLLDAIRADWRKLQLIEQAMVVGRVTRSYPKRKHYLDMTNKDKDAQEKTLRSYIQRITNRAFGQRLLSADNVPLADVGEDLYIGTGYITGPDGQLMPKLNKVDLEDPSLAGVAHMDDLTYFRQKCWVLVPSDIVGIKRNTTGDLDSQDLAFSRMLRRLQKQMEIGIRQILDSALMATGRVGVQYRVIFPTITVGAAWKHSDARFRDSMTNRNYIETSTISHKFAAKRTYQLTDSEWDQMQAEIQAEKDSGLYDAPGLTPAAPGPTNAGPDGTGNQPAPGNAKASAAPKAKPAITATGVDRGTKAGQALRGNMSGG